MLWRRRRPGVAEEAHEGGNRIQFGADNKGVGSVGLGTEQEGRIKKGLVW